MRLLSFSALLLLACSSGEVPRDNSPESSGSTSGPTGGMGQAGASGQAGGMGPTGGMGQAGASGPLGGMGQAGSPSSDAGATKAPGKALALAGQPCNGYTLLSNSENDTNSPLPATLIDMTGQVVHQWGIMGFPAKMLPGGFLIGSVGVVPGDYDTLEVQQLDWDGNLEWSFSDWVPLADGTPAARQHHDFQREGSPHGTYAPGHLALRQGKTLLLTHVQRTVPTIRPDPLNDDAIFEVDATGTMTGFTWYGSDHIDEYGFDQAALDDIRTRSPGNALEWLHGNSISRLGPNHWYDAGLAAFHPDNIIYSSRDSNMILIIAADTGDIVWRMGPEFAGRPEERLGQFSGQHNPYMIPKGLPGAGNILVFDNGGPAGFGGTSTQGLPNRHVRDYSRVVEFDPTTFEPVWEYGTDLGDASFYSYLISNAQRLPNGNTMVTVGMDGRLFEVTPAGDVVWSYQSPPKTADHGSRVYRAYRIPPEWLPEGKNAEFADYPTWASLFEQ